jgi:hypothetical protein
LYQKVSRTCKETNEIGRKCGKKLNTKIIIAEEREVLVSRKPQDASQRHHGGARRARRQEGMKKWRLLAFSH